MTMATEEIFYKTNRNIKSWLKELEYGAPDLLS